MRVSYRCALLTLVWSLAAAALFGQQTAAPPVGVPPESESSPIYQRQQILQSERWRNLERSFHQWLSVQSIYSPAEITQLKVAVAGTNYVDVASTA